MLLSKLWAVPACFALMLYSMESAPSVEDNGSSGDLDSGYVEVVPEVDLEEFEVPEDVVILPAEPEAEAEPQEEPEVSRKLVAIDAGHQGKGNSEKEPIGPGATTTKAKVSSGTTGRFTGIPEYILTLEIAIKLEAALLDMGYDVLMIRDTHDIDISNAERAIMANEAEADAFIRIHANGDNNSSVEGAFTICPTPYNPYCSEIYAESRLLSEKVLDSFIEETGAKRRAIWETDTMTGINWCSVPVTIIEMGFMTNEKEDRLMATEEYQWSMVKGMAEGIHQYFLAWDELYAVA